MFGRSNTLGIGMSIYLQDQFSGNAQRIMASMNGLSNNAQRLMNRNLANMSQAGLGMAAVGMGILYSVRSMVKTYADFDHALNYIRTTTEDVGYSMDTLKDKILSVGTASVFNLQEIANAAVELGKAGFTRERIDKSIGGITNIAAATKSSLSEATDLALGLINTFDIAPAAMDRLADKVVYAANQSAAGIHDITEAYTKAGPALRAANVPLEQSLAMFMKLSQHNLKGSRAGTALENLVMYAAKGVTPFMTGNQEKALTAMGLGPQELKDAYGNLLPLDQLLAKLKKGMAGMGSTDQLALMSAFTGERGKRALALANAINSNTKNFGDFLEGLNQLPVNYALNQAKELTNDIWGDLKGLQNTFMDFKMRVVDPMIPMLRIGVKAVTALLKGVGYLISLPGVKYITALYLFMGLAAAATGVFTWAMAKATLGIRSGIMSWASWRNTASFALNTVTAQLLRFSILQRGVNMQGIVAAGLNPLTGKPQFRSTTTGRFVSTPTAGRTTIIGGAAAVAGRGMGGLTNLLGFGTRRALVSTGLGGILRGAGAIMTRGAGLLLGPWGLLAITALSLTGAFDKLLGSVGSNEDAMVKHDEVLKDGTRVKRFIDMDRGIPGTAGMKLPGADKTEQMINIYIDGEQKMRKTIDQSAEDMAVNLDY